MVMASFDPRHIRTYFPALAKVTDRFARRWRRAASAGETIDLQSDLMRYTVDVTSGLALGVDMNTLELLEVQDYYRVPANRGNFVRSGVRLYADLPFRTDASKGIPASVYETTRSQPLRTGVRATCGQPGRAS